MLFFIEFDKEFLGVTAGLGARSGTDVLLDLLPLLAVQLEGLEEAEVLLAGPATGALADGLAVLGLEKFRGFSLVLLTLSLYI